MNTYETSGRSQIQRTKPHKYSIKIFFLYMKILIAAYNSITEAHNMRISVYEWIFRQLSTIRPTQFHLPRIRCNLDI